MSYKTIKLGDGELSPTKPITFIINTSCLKCNESNIQKVENVEIGHDVEIKSTCKFCKSSFISLVNVSKDKILTIKSTKCF